MNAALVLIALGLAVILILAAPLLRRRDGADPGAAPLRPDAEPEPSDADAEALREIELDRAMGKLSEEDYLALRAQYERQMEARVAERPSSRGGAPSPAAAPTPPVGGTAVDARRSGDTPPSDPEELAEWLVRRAREVTITCPACGVRPEPDARYCSNCGRYLERCPACGGAVEELGARFCSHCGAPLAA